MSRRFRLRVAALGSAAAAGVAGCTGSSTPQPSPPQTTSSSPSASESPAASPAQRLQQLAQLGSTAAFHGTYVVRQRHPAGRATWRVWRTSTSLRVDVITKNVTATLIRTPQATYSCRRSGHRKTCFRVAKGNQPIPVPVRLSAELLFTSDLTRLAKHPSTYSVTAPPSGSIPVRTAGAECFKVTVPKRSAAHLESATYCFTTGGILSVVVYPSGNIVQGKNVVLHAPSGRPFRPYASPTPLPV